MKKTAISLLLALATFCSAAQTNRKGLDPAMVNFFEGKWLGTGEFASGKKISANVSFSPALDSAWLVNNHSDQAPNRYKAISYWGVDPLTGINTAFIFDNFQGSRKFNSTGWDADQLILSNSSEQAGKKFFQHFIYKKLTANSYKMTYETSRDSLTWKLGDYLIFNRVQP